MKSTITRILFVLCLLLSDNIHTFASHITGGAMYYKHISDSTYRISLELYLDCTTYQGVDSVGYRQEPLLCVMDTSYAPASTYLDTLHLFVDMAQSGQEVLRPCFAEHTQCTGGSNIIGLKKFVYSAVYTLKHRTARPLTLFYYGMNGGAKYMLSGRVFNLSNVLDDGKNIWLECLLNTNLGNSNAEASHSFQPYYCINSPSVYYPELTDADGDSIAVAIVPPTTTNDPIYYFPYPEVVNFKAPYSLAEPFAVQPGSFSFSGSTGNMSFVPSMQQRALVDYKISEYRNGIFVGSSIRELIILATPCLDSCTIDTAANGVVNYYPNPVDDRLEIHMIAKPYNNVTIFDALGRRIFEEKYEMQTKFISTTYWPDGIYMLVFDGAAGRKIDKLVVRH